MSSVNSLTDILDHVEDPTVEKELMENGITPETVVLINANSLTDAQVYQDAHEYAEKVLSEKPKPEIKKVPEPKKEPEVKKVPVKKETPKIEPKPISIEDMDLIVAEPE